MIETLIWSELSEGKSKNSQASALLPSASCNMVPAEGGSSCVALGQQTPGLQPIYDIGKVQMYQHDCVKEEGGD